MRVRATVRNFSQTSRLRLGRGLGNLGGFTLIEMLIALVILSVAVLGLTTVTLTSIRVNLQNDLRSTAVRLTTEKSEELLAQKYGDIASGTEAVVVPLRAGNHTFDVTWTVTELNAKLRQINVTVAYDWRDQSPRPSNTAVIFRHEAM